MKPMTTLFISHGAPDIVLSEIPALTAWRSLAGELRRPRAIVMVSAHWIDSPIGITTDNPDGTPLTTIHDFGGFPQALYALQYPARGDDALASEVARRLQQQGFDTALHPRRGLDHGAWIPLMIMYPEADIPVVQVSLPSDSLDEVAQLGRALSPLRDEDILLIGSGGSVHNLRALHTSGQTDDWALRFEDWLHATITGSHFERLLTPEKFSTDFHQAQPSMEHYAPLVFAWAAANPEQAGRRLHHSFSYGNLGMSVYAFD